VEAGEFGQAIKVYEQARTDKILDISSEHRLADAYLKMSDAARAISVYERILENGIEDNRAANNLAALVADYFPNDLDRLARARELTSAFDQSDNPYFLDTLGWVNHHLGNHLDAITYLERAVSARNIPQIHYHLGMAYQASGQPLPARMQLELALAGDPEPFIGIDDARETLNALQTEAQDL
jgi:tetratricopeptide (TPR) repeat protein